MVLKYLTSHLSIENTSEWKKSFASTDEFYNEFRSTFSNLRLGCSFSSEYLTELFNNNITQKEIINILEFIINDLKIKDIRFGIRWDRVAESADDIDFSYYQFFLDYLISRNCRICLNIGPIKTFRWPEQHVSERIINQLKTLPKKGSVIKKDSEIAILAFSYIDKLLKNLTSLYSPQDLQNLKIIQIENEPFHKFGTHEWVFEEEYLESLIYKVRQYLPGVKFLFNSSEYSDLNKISTFFDSLIKNNNSLKNHLIGGINYFYKVPGKVNKRLNNDSVKIAQKMLINPYKDFIRKSQKVGFDIEITEGQAEKWDNITSPGNSAQEFKFMILRCANNIIDLKKPSLIRIWGIEGLVKNLIGQSSTSDHKEIFKLVSLINARQ